MKKCQFCGTPWRGYGAEPRSRERCRGCRRFLHCCLNCHHFDRETTNACKLPHTTYIGARDDLNYCEEFQMADSTRKEVESRIARARDRWEALFRR